MLVLTLKPGESIRIGDDISITASQVIGHGVKLGIDAPRDVLVLRQELVAGEKRPAAELTLDERAKQIGEAMVEGLRRATFKPPPNER